MSILVILALLSTEPTLEPRYAECIARIDQNVEEGRIAAQRWVDEGGGADARHCLAIADLRAGFPKLAAARLEDIAERKDAGDDYVRAKILAQAAEAWLDAKELDHAEQAVQRALGLVPDSGELQLTAAKVCVALERWQAVIDAVNAAEQAGFISAETYVYRGKAHFMLTNYEAAAQDVVNALTIDPTYVDALVLRGEIQQTGVSIDVSYGAFKGKD